MQTAVGHRTRVHPGRKYRPDRAPQLRVRILREILAGLARHRILVLADQLDPVVAGEVGVERVALAVLEGIEDVFEMMVLEAEHDVRIHRDEAAIAVIGEAAVAGQFGERFDGLVVEAEIEHGVHHARHRGAAAGADRHQKRIPGIAERLAGQLADMIQRLFDLRLQFLRIGFVVRIKVGADRGRNGEAGRHRQTEIGHFGEIGALAAEQIAQARLPFSLAVTEGVDPFSGLYRRYRGLTGGDLRRGLPRRLGNRLGGRFGRRLGRALLQRLAGRRRGLGSRG